jgi:hypothetical protein
MRNMQYHVGQWVEVRSMEEILSTLDRRGRLEGLPFMPQMFRYCGQRFRVYKRAHKTCDTVNDYKGRRMNRAVHLDGIRCDGQAYGGCRAGGNGAFLWAFVSRLAAGYPDRKRENRQNDGVQESMHHSGWRCLRGEVQ